MIPLAEALDTSGLSWSVSGSPVWVGQAAISHDNMDAARSGAIGHSTDTRMETTVVGPGTVSFWWKVSSQTNGDYLRFYLDGTLMESISGEVDWVKRTYSVPSGSSTI